MKTTSKVLLALLAGMAAGSALGLLFAPASGTETLEKLTRPFKAGDETAGDETQPQEVEDTSEDKVESSLDQTGESLEDDFEQA